jgi:hypothetical protein
MLLAGSRLVGGGAVDRRTRLERHRVGELCGERDLSGVVEAVVANPDTGDDLTVEDVAGRTVVTRLPRVTRR